MVPFLTAVMASYQSDDLTPTGMAKYGPWGRLWPLTNFLWPLTVAVLCMILCTWATSNLKWMWGHILYPWSYYCVWNGVPISYSWKWCKTTGFTVWFKPQAWNPIFLRAFSIDNNFNCTSSFNQCSSVQSGGSQHIIILLLLPYSTLYLVMSEVALKSFQYWNVGPWPSIPWPPLPRRLV